MHGLLTDKFIVSGAGLCLLVLCGLGWFALGDAFGQRRKPTYSHLHCSLCRRELNYSPALEGKTCPTCRELGSELLPTVGSFAGGGYDPAKTSFGKIVFLLVGMIVMIQAQVFLWIWRARVLRRRHEEQANERFACRCPFCARKLGYTARKAGTGAVCPSCKTGFLLPEIDDPRHEGVHEKFACRCPFCAHKLAYAASKAGTGAVCPSCQTGFLLPEIDDTGATKTSH